MRVLCSSRASAKYSALTFALSVSEVSLVDVKRFGSRSWHVLTDDFYGGELKFVAATASRY